MKSKLFILLLINFGLVSVSFSQSKKEQIIALNKQLDSLNNIVSLAREKNIDLIRQNDELKNNESILLNEANKLRDKNKSLNTLIDDLNSNIQKLSLESSTLKQENLNQRSTISDLKYQLIIKTDSLKSILTVSPKVDEDLNLFIVLKGRKKIVARNDFDKKMNWAEAKKACERLGQGWRLPNNEELLAMYEQLYKKKIGGLYLYGENVDNSDMPSEYWSLIENTPGDREEAYFFCFANGILQNTADSNGRDKFEEYNVRAIKDLD